MQCVRPALTGDEPPGASGRTLLATEHFVVNLRSASAGRAVAMPKRRCAALMFLQADQSVQVRHAGPVEPAVRAGAGDTVLVPADLAGAELAADGQARWLEILLPER